jgi:hypothetical protein
LNKVFKDDKLTWLMNNINENEYIWKFEMTKKQFLSKIFLVLSTYIRNEEKSQIDEVNFHYNREGKQNNLKQK